MLPEKSLQSQSGTECPVEIARQVLRVESEALTAVAGRLGDEFDQAVRLLAECRGNVIVTGMGKAGHVGQKIAATLTSTNTRAFFLHPGEAVHGDLGCVGALEIVLALSNSGETAEIKQILRPVAQIGATLIAITGRARSTLARAAKVAIIYGDLDEACPIGMAPTTSTTVMMAIGDALAVALMKIRAVGWDDFLRYHPAGSLGRKLQTVEEIMRCGEQLRIAESQLTVAEVFVRVQRPGRRTGAIMLVDRSGKLEGLFTDSDLARLFEKRDLSAFERPIGEYMTRQPIVLRQGQRVVDALALLRHRRISEIPVLDADGRPVGLVDITDIVDLLPQAA